MDEFLDSLKRQVKVWLPWVTGTLAALCLASAYAACLQACAAAKPIEAEASYGLSLQDCNRKAKAAGGGHDAVVTAAHKCWEDVDKAWGVDAGKDWSGK